jgi:hypothetical protein
MFEIPKDKYSAIKYSKLSAMLFKIATPFIPKIVEKETPLRLKKDYITVTKQEEIAEPPKIIEPKEKTSTKSREVFDKLFTKAVSVRNAIAELLTKRYSVETSSEPPPRLEIIQRSGAPYGCMSLLEAIKKRRAQLKAEIIKNNILKRMDDNFIKNIVTENIDDEDDDTDE